MRKIGSKIICVLALALCLAALTGAISFYLGYRNYYQYQMARQEIKSLEKDFLGLERRLQQAVIFYPLPLFYDQLGQLRLERALAEIEFGLPEKSEGYLDGAREALMTAITSNPVDYSAFWELGKVYFLYNYPLPTYAQKGRDFCREAIRRYPYNGFLNLNVLFVFFNQWPLLEENERDWLREKIQTLSVSNPGFLDKLKNKWRQNYKETTELEIRLKELGLWERTSVQ
jgi:hypothetical protein